LIAAFYGRSLVGIIEWNLEEDSFMFGKRKSVNVGEVYVKPSLRGSGLVKALLNTAENRAMNAGFEYMWVEHGTANPNARGFWNKYFQTYQYELVRTV
jgi:ribosomal protein S18 acetylase RimI-like enzyme